MLLYFDFIKSSLTFFISGTSSISSLDQMMTKFYSYYLEISSQFLKSPRKNSLLNKYLLFSFSFLMTWMTDLGVTITRASFKSSLPTSSSCFLTLESKSYTLRATISLEAPNIPSLFSTDK